MAKNTWDLSLKQYSQLTTKGCFTCYRIYFSFISPWKNSFFITSNFEITFNANSYLSSFFSTKKTFPKYTLPRLLSNSKEVKLMCSPSWPIIVSVLSIFYCNSNCFSFMNFLKISNETFFGVTLGYFSFLSPSFFDSLTYTT